MTTDFEKSQSIINRMLKGDFSKQVSHGSNFTAHSITRSSNSAPGAYIVRKIYGFSDYLNKLLWWLLESDYCLVMGFERDLINTTPTSFQLLKSYIP